MRTALLTPFLLLLAIPAIGQEAKQDDKPVPKDVQEKIEQAKHEATVEIAEMLLRDLDADDYLGYADSLKEDGDYDKAAVFYLVSVKMNPKGKRALYQLACNFALWEQEDLAVAWLGKAVDAGFWGYALMKDDSDLASIRSRKEYKELAAKVEARYKVEAPKHVGESLIRKPKGRPPAGGWPVVVLLHGFGADPENFAGVADCAAANGYAGIAISGPDVLDESAFAWPDDAVERVHTYLQKTLEPYRKDKDLDFKRVYVAGFSQGAMQSGLLVASHGETYLGGVAISPGGLSNPPSALPKSAPARPLFVLYGEMEPLGAANADAFKAAWSKAGWPFRSAHHPGGHAFPEDWEKTFADALAWLANPGR